MCFPDLFIILRNQLEMFLLNVDKFVAAELITHSTFDSAERHSVYLTAVR